MIDKELKEWALHTNIDAIRYNELFLKVQISEFTKEKIKKDIKMIKKLIKFIKQLKVKT